MQHSKKSETVCKEMQSGSYPPAWGTHPVRTADFDLLGTELGQDVEAALSIALSQGAVFPEAGDDALGLFRQALAGAIRDIALHPWGLLCQEFLRKGPYEDTGDIPAAYLDSRLPDADTRRIVTFISAHMINVFKGSVTEMLAAGACTDLMKRLELTGELPRRARLYIGDSVTIPRVGRTEVMRGADMHILIEEFMAPARVMVAAVGEVKSYLPQQRLLRKQLSQHLQRARGGLRVRGVNYPATAVHVGRMTRKPAIRIAVVPDTWKLPRTFHFKGSTLHVDQGHPPYRMDNVVQTGRNEWRITLRWSLEALEEAAYAMTFWYMGKVGEFVFSSGLPKEWNDMTPQEAGHTALKNMLSYAILRCNGRREQQRAIALYNTYCFGYAVGMNFRNAHGWREMLWPKDLAEILASGQTGAGHRLR